MSRVIIFCGLPGTGKTTLAQALSKKLNVCILRKDAIKEFLYDELEGATLEDSHRIGKISILLILRLAEEALQNGVDIILDSPFDYPDNPRLFREWQEKNKVKVFIIVCTIGAEVRRERRGSRERHSAHHDRERFGLPSDQIEFDYSVMPEPKLILHTQKPVDSLLQEVLDFLGSQN